MVVSAREGRAWPSCRSGHSYCDRSMNAPMTASAVKVESHATESLSRIASTFFIGTSQVQYSDALRKLAFAREQLHWARLIRQSRIFDCTMSLKEYCLKSASDILAVRNTVHITLLVTYTYFRFSVAYTVVTCCLLTCSLRPLQLAQNAARLKLESRATSKPFVQQLDWQPIAKRVEGKILKIVLKCQDGLCTSYFTNSSGKKGHYRSVRSASCHVSP